MSKLPIFSLFLGVANLKPKLKWFFKAKLNPNCFQLNRAPGASAQHLQGQAVGSRAEEEKGQGPPGQGQGRRAGRAGRGGGGVGRREAAGDEGRARQGLHVHSRSH